MVEMFCKVWLLSAAPSHCYTGSLIKTTGSEHTACSWQPVALMLPAVLDADVQLMLTTIPVIVSAALQGA
jgi:hypothetical protein